MRLNIDCDLFLVILQIVWDWYEQIPSNGRGFKQITVQIFIFPSSVPTASPKKPCLKFIANLLSVYKGFFST